MPKVSAILAMASAVIVSSAAFAGPAEDANAVVDRWAAAYTSNDVDAIARLYSPNAVLLGTTSPIISEGSEGIREYFKDMPGSGRRNSIEDRRTLILSDTVVVVTGFYDFYRREQPGVPRPSRFTMVVTHTGSEWVIAHHHSSPRSATRQ